MRVVGFGRTERRVRQEPLAHLLHEVGRDLVVGVRLLGELHWLGRGRVGLRGGDVVVLRHRREHLVATGVGRGRVVERIVVVGRLQETGERGALHECELRRGCPK